MLILDVKVGTSAGMRAHGAAELTAAALKLEPIRAASEMVLCRDSRKAHLWQSA